MNRVSSFVFGMIVGVLGLYITMHFSLVRASDGYHVIPKIAAKMEVPYSDIRKFTLENWQRRQSLALSMSKGKQKPSALRPIADWIPTINATHFGSIIGRNNQSQQRLGQSRRASLTRYDRKI